MKAITPSALSVGFWDTWWACVAKVYQKTKNKINLTDGKQVINRGQGRMEYRPRATEVEAQKINKPNLANPTTPGVINKTGGSNATDFEKEQDTVVQHRTDVDLLIQQNLAKSGLIDTLQHSNSPSEPNIQSSPFASTPLKASDIRTKEGLNDPSGSGNIKEVTTDTNSNEVGTKLGSQKKASGVITTPTKNRFDVLDT